MKALLAIAATSTLFFAGAASAQVRDARGIVVESQTATPPAGLNQNVTVPPGATLVPAPNQQSFFTTQPATQEYPACTAGQTDRCVQTYERGSPRTRRGRR